MDSDEPRVLVLGLDPTRVPGPWDPAPVVRRIEAGMAQFERHGVAVASCLVGLDGSDDVPAVFEEAIASHPWECVVVGGGLRDPDLLDVLETVLNLIRRRAPQAAIAFNATPEDTYAAAARHLPPP